MEQFSWLPNSDEILSAVNTDELEYAAGISNDELTFLHKGSISYFR
jgi:hypothetical protein